VLCDLVIDDGYVNSAYVASTALGLLLYNQTGLGTCKYNGEGYTCQSLVVNHPSHHTIENIQADAEVVAVFRSPTGKILSVSSLVRVNPAQTDASRFLNSFIPYANSMSSPPVNIVLGNNWSLTMMVPPNATFYSYQGTVPFPYCEIAQVIVFSSMINIDQNDFALLAKNGVAGSRPIQPLGDRQVFFNSGDQLPGGTTPKDGKVYMRLHPKKDTGKKQKNDAKHADVGGAYSNEKNKGGFISAIAEWAHDQVAVNGVLSIINVVLLLLSFSCALYYAMKYHSQFNILLVLNKKAGDFGAWLRSKVVGGTPSYSSPSIPSTPSSAPSKPTGQLLPTRPAQPITRAVERSASAVVPDALVPVDEALGSPTATPLAPGTSSRRVFTPQTRGSTPTRSASVPLARNTTTPASNRNLGFGPTRPRAR
jgi:hypothetical protein